MTLCLALLALWVLIGVAGLARPQSLVYVAPTLLPLGAVCGAALTVVAALERLVLPICLPDLPIHLRLDALLSVFQFLLGAISQC